MRRADIDCAGIADRRALHATLKEALALPEYYGNNLDALADCLSDLFEDTCLVLRHPNALRDALGDYAEALLHVLHRGALDNRHFVFLIVEDAPRTGN